MEENNNMTAECSLEIITAQIERSRQVVGKDTGLSLYVAGLYDGDGPPHWSLYLFYIQYSLLSAIHRAASSNLLCRSLCQTEQAQGASQFCGNDGR